MAMTANLPLSPQPVAVGSATDNGDVSPRTRRRNLTSPWSQVVIGVESLPKVTATSVSPPPTLSVVPNFPESANATGTSGQMFSPEITPESSNKTDDNADDPKKLAWKKPTNGVTEPSSVMGGSDSWPALSETRYTGKTSSDSTNPVSEGSTSSSQGPIISQPPQRQVNTNPNLGMHRQRSMKHRGGSSGPISGSRPVGGSAQGSGPIGGSRPVGGLAQGSGPIGGSRPVGGSAQGNGAIGGGRPIGGSAQAVYNRSPPPPPPPPFPQFPFMEMPQYGNYGNFVAPSPPSFDSRARGPRPMGVVATPAANDHLNSHSQRNSYRRNNFGPHPRGDGQYHHGGRRDSDRRDIHVPRQFIPRSFVPPPPPLPPAPFVPMHMGHMVSPMAFDMRPHIVYVPTLPPEPFRAVPLMAQGSRDLAVSTAPGSSPPTDNSLAVSTAPGSSLPTDNSLEVSTAPGSSPDTDNSLAVSSAPGSSPPTDNSLAASIVNQIDYYFSDINLVKDTFLRSKMDDEGWVSIILVAGFPLMLQLTSDIPLILDSLKSSKEVEVKGNMIRKRDSWHKWIYSSSRMQRFSISQTPTTSLGDNLQTSSKKLPLNDDSSSNLQVEILLAAESPNVGNGEATAEESCSSQT